MSVKTVELNRTDIDVATMYDPKNWFGKGQYERETSSVTFVINFRQNKKLNFGLQSVSWSLAEFRHNRIVQSPHENYFKVCR